MNPNNIQKKSWIQVTRDNGEVILGIATKVAPWSKNPKITVVNWKDATDTYTCTADARKCRLATDAEINAFNDAKLAKYAPLDEPMQKWSIGKLKKGPQMMEGFYFSAPVLLNGVKVGEIMDEGNGGPINTRFKDHTLSLAFEKDCDTWAIASGADGRCADGTENFWGWWDDARTKCIDAKTFFKGEKEQMLKFFAGT